MLFQNNVLLQKWYPSTLQWHQNDHKACNNTIPQMSYCVLASHHLMLVCKSWHCKMTSSRTDDHLSPFLPYGWPCSANSFSEGLCKLWVLKDSWIHFSPGERGISFLSKFCLVECLVKQKTKEPSKRVILNMLLADVGGPGKRNCSAGKCLRIAERAAMAN